jgi:hypothetical protein
VREIYRFEPTVFYDATQRRLVVVSYRRLGTIYWHHLRSSSNLRLIFKDLTDSCHETSVNNHQCALRDLLEGRRLYFHHNGSLIPHFTVLLYIVFSKRNVQYHFNYVECKLVFLKVFMFSNLAPCCRLHNGCEHICIT